MRPLILIYLSFGLLIFTSCSYKQNQVLFEQRGSAPDSNLNSNLTNIGNYRIKPQDILQITNVQNSKNIIDLTAAATATANSNTVPLQQGENYQVEEDGTIALTGIGWVKVAGLTRVEARKYIEELYHKDFLKDPILNLKIISLKVTILGEVKTPGNFPLTKDRTTLVELLGEAGGLTDKANEKNVKIIHSDEKTDVINLNDVRSLNDPRTIVRNNDVIYISQNKRAIRNDKLQDFSTIVQPILIILNTALVIYTLTRN
jgi:polysaccharide export outer membrane protein